MNSHNPKTAKKENAPTRPENSTELTRDGMGLPHLSRQPADHPSDSELVPVADSVDIDDGINADKAAAESRHAAAKAKANEQPGK